MARKVIFFTHVPSLGVNRALTAASVQSGCGFLFNAYPYWRISVHHLRGNLQGRETFDARERDLTINMGALSTPFLLFPPSSLLISTGLREISITSALEFLSFIKPKASLFVNLYHLHSLSSEITSLHLHR
jgi:hypothetical protein